MRKKKNISPISRHFANSAGGVLFFGIEEENGVPVRTPGVPLAGLDGEILRLENLARDSVESRIPGLKIQSITMSKSASVVGVRIPRSWVGPHMVTAQGSSRFYARNSRGKYQMDLGEIRAAFSSVGSLRERIRAFRIQRVADIVADETPLHLPEGPRVILHVIPLDALDSGARLDIANFDNHQIHLTAIASSSFHNIRHNFDGVVVSPSAASDDEVLSYAQLFRNGIIEAVRSSLINPYDEELLIRSLIVEARLIVAMGDYLAVERRLGMEPPLIIFITITGAKGYRIEPYTDNHHLRFDSLRLPMDRDPLMLPELLIESYDIDPATALRPAFDTLWQTCGWERSLNYDSEGIHRSARPL